MFYRFIQLWNALSPKIDNNEYAWVNSILQSNELELFFKQTLTEQRHAIDVALDINHQKHSIEQDLGETSFHHLIHAALLHDCGKSLFKLYLWQRVFIVVAGYLPYGIQDKLMKQRNILGKTLVIYKQHAAWGKRLASKAGICEEIQILIKKHHSPGNTSEYILYQADNRH